MFEAWIISPGRRTQLVVGSNGDIYCWELTDEAHPESDKPTFHVYIVDKDLEKLAKEKKQDLGKNN